MGRQVGIVARRDTRRAILDLMRSAGAVSRVELAQLSGLTEATISRHVKPLLAEGVVEETGRGAPTGGMRSTLLQISKGAHHAVGASLNDRHITYVVTNVGGETIGEHVSDGIGHQSRADVIGRMAIEIDSLISGLGIDRRTLLGIGVASPNRRTNTYPTGLHPIGAEWNWDFIESELTAATGLPVAVDNDSTCAAIGEFWIGRISTTRDFGVVNMDLGFGFGLVTGGDVYRGSTSNVGELGHVIIDMNGAECDCGSRGCLETLATPWAIVARARQIEPLRRQLGLSDNDDMWDNFVAIATAAMEGMPEAVRLIEEAASFLASALVSLTNILDLDRIVLTGPGFDVAGNIFARVAQDELARRAFIRDVHSTDVRLSGSGQNSAALGAATLVFHQQLGEVSHA